VAMMSDLDARSSFFRPQLIVRIFSALVLADIVIHLGLPARYASGSVSSSLCARVSTEVF